MQEHILLQRVSAARQGDNNSLAILFKYYRPRLYPVALKLAGYDMASDILQDTYISAFTHIHTLRDDKLFFFTG